MIYMMTLVYSILIQYSDITASMLYLNTTT
ncbi:hypothetical protein E2C01_031624 [Portunus trituberculatus]|uniref:Uncharacterized protein n=1 Tax=Portunus trituberculatus TaxID=210409 RepID=A0A5B7ETY7_PORTR|nr:hypothetical protein [Portunus trituberculatus]